LKGEYYAYIFNTTNPAVIGIPGTNGLNGTLVPYFAGIKGPDDTTPYQDPKVVVQTVAFIKK